MNEQLPKIKKGGQTWLWWVLGGIIFFILVCILSAISDPNIKINNSETRKTLNVQTTGNNASVTTESGCINWQQFSADDQTQISKIVQTVMQGGAEMPTVDLYNEFWPIINRYGKFCNDNIALVENNFTAAAECSKIFYQDALQSLRIGQPFKSQQRLDCEEQTILALLPKEQADQRIAANEILINKITLHQPITTASGNIVFTEEMIQMTITNINNKLAQLDKLFTPNLSLDAGDVLPTKQINSESSVHITNNPALDKECEKEHGPSIYKSIPKSMGGGAYCDCKSGYVSQPITAADGSPSSWCVKE